MAKSDEIMEASDVDLEQLDEQSGEFEEEFGDCNGNNWGRPI